MFKNYFNIALRNLWKNKGISTINILGLSLGIATCLLIMLFVQKELSYDRFNEKSDRLYRVTFNSRMQGGDLKEASVMPPVAQTLKNDYPEVEEATRLQARGGTRITYGNKVFTDGLAYVDPNFFTVFTLPLEKGNAATALLEPNTAIITSVLAKKYFGTADPIGKVLTLKDQHTFFTVTGVVKEIPENSHFHFEVFASTSNLPEANESSWMVSGFYTYVVLRKGTDPKKFAGHFPEMVQKYIGPQLKQGLGVTLAELESKGNSISFALQPITDIHLHSNLTGDMEPGGDIKYVYIFSAVALFMLLIACINFMNLSTASAAKRAKEIGIRKVLGSVKKQLVSQFLLESLFITSIALLIGILLVYVLLPFFNDLTGQHLKISLTNSPYALPLLIAFGLFTGILAGSYPAFFLSSFKPVEVLKGKFSTGKKSAGLRSGLVVFQFIISISLIIGTTVVYKQLSYIRNKELGFDKEQVLVIEQAYWLNNNLDVFRSQLMQDPGVKSVSVSGFLPAGNSANNNFFVSADDNAQQLIKTLRYDVDENYLPTLGISIASGRNFSPQFPTDSSGIIINEAAARSFGWTNDPLNHTLTHNSNDGSKESYHVIGVVKDFNFRSLHEAITPLVMVLAKDNGSVIVKVKTADMPGLLANIQQKWKNLHAEAPFSYSFLDDRFNNTYKAEQYIGRILGIFAGLTIFVACLGLFGLATFMAEQRRKEIGIRKVLGADVSGLVAMLSKDFLKLVLIAFIIASPIAWYVMNRWLQEFAYRISISVWVFAITAFLAAIITLLTVSFQAVRSARANPVNSLRSE
ncbi:ABC transporter permease [Ferruginibacter sp. HRS2-29]|uniref:ABC transporter permease n=1 Tax=Ferruginibacter sp. HRS2-29 TaxID=2487334 RepID=UPI0020CEAE43|nr:ABC transporter permease [Ferruginibacter sp. HRS2-29]MCP9752067.1 FtsX-like permease family protein [Ferruginibacter sp. HRS2-29]